MRPNAFRATTTTTLGSFIPSLPETINKACISLSLDCGIECSRVRPRRLVAFLAVLSYSLWTATISTGDGAYVLHARILPTASLNVKFADDEDMDISTADRSTGRWESDEHDEIRIRYVRGGAENTIRSSEQTGVRPHPFS
jgi:hypothetical protein